MSLIVALFAPSDTAKFWGAVIAVVMALLGAIGFALEVRDHVGRHQRLRWVLVLTALTLGLLLAAHALLTLIKAPPPGPTIFAFILPLYVEGPLALALLSFGTVVAIAAKPRNRRLPHKQERERKLVAGLLGEGSMHLQMLADNCKVIDGLADGSTLAICSAPSGNLDFDSKWICKQWQYRAYEIIAKELGDSYLHEFQSTAGLTPTRVPPSNLLTLSREVWHEIAVQMDWLQRRLEGLDSIDLPSPPANIHIYPTGQTRPGFPERWKAAVDAHNESERTKSVFTLTYRVQGTWVRLIVRNDTQTEHRFKAQVINIEGGTVPAAIPWSIPWRDWGAETRELGPCEEQALNLVECDGMGTLTDWTAAEDRAGIFRFPTLGLTDEIVGLPLVRDIDSLTEESITVTVRVNGRESAVRVGFKNEGFPQLHVRAEEIMR